MLSISPRPQSNEEALFVEVLAYLSLKIPSAPTIIFEVHCHQLWYGFIMIVWRIYDSPDRENMMTSSNGNIFLVTHPLCGEIHWSPVKSPHKGDTELWCFLWLRKQSWGWWFETPSRSLWRYCNDSPFFQRLTPAMVPLVVTTFRSLTAAISLARQQWLGSLRSWIAQLGVDLWLN